MGILSPGDKLIVVHRRLFETDSPRYFLGVVSDYENGVFKMEGWTFLNDLATKKVFRKPGKRTKIYSVASGTVLIYQLPGEVEVEKVEISGRSGGLVATDSSHFELDLSEQFRDLPSANSIREWSLLRPI